jgi:hypothetical protein
VHSEERAISLSLKVCNTDCNAAIRPANAKRSDVKKILNAAALHFEELAGLWEETHGKA